MDDLFLPRLARITEVRDETPDTKTFALRFRDETEQERFDFRPGQFVELSVFGCGEAPFCLASSPTRPRCLETTVRRTGRLTNALHELGPGDEVGLRGPFGNGFDVPAAHGKDLLFVGGGIGLPPLRGLIWASNPGESAMAKPVGISAVSPAFSTTSRSTAAQTSMPAECSVTYAGRGISALVGSSRVMRTVVS